MVISPTCRASVGAWDESYFLYSEETDYALRAADAGFAVRYTPAARVTHVGGDQAASPALWALGATNRVELYRRRHGTAAGFAYRVAVIANEAVRAGRASTHRAALGALVRVAAVVASPWPTPPGARAGCASRARTGGATTEPTPTSSS